MLDINAKVRGRSFVKSNTVKVSIYCVFMWQLHCNKWPKHYPVKSKNFFLSFAKAHKN
jgi:hypothetical protein